LAREPVFFASPAMVVAAIVDPAGDKFNVQLASVNISPEKMAIPCRVLIGEVLDDHSREFRADA
jgi:hypothetical protein